MKPGTSGAPNSGPNVPQITMQERVVRRNGSLETIRSSYIEHWMDINKHLSPRTGRFTATDTNNGTKKHNLIYDNTGTRALGILKAGLMAGATSPARPWFRLTTPDAALAERRPVKEWLHLLSTRMRLVFDRSNTYRALPQMYGELGAYGTACSVLLPDYENVIHHNVLTIGEYCLSCNGRGVVDTMSRSFQMSVEAVVREFGYKNCAPSTQRSWDEFNYTAMVTVLHVVQPRELSKRDLRRSDGPNMQYQSIYIELGRQLEETVVLRDSGFRTFRVLAPRWETMGLDAYGSNCPGMTSLGDLKQLQHDQYQRAKAVDYMSDPPIQVPTAMRNQENDFLPGGVSYVDMTGPHNGVRTAFDVQLNISHLDAGLVDIRDRITSAFFADLFLMLINDQRSNITAREIAERHEEKLLMLGPVLESVHNELLGPMIDLTFEQIIEAGIMPPAPPDLEGIELKVEFVSMLAQAQKAIGLSSVDRMLGTVGAIAQHQLAAGRDGDVWDKIDTDQVIDNYADMLGLDPNLIVEDDQVAEKRQQRAQAIQQQQMQESIAQNSQTAKTLSETKTDEGSALSNVINMFSGYRGA